MLTLKSYAKVNLYLEVLNLRKDGFHNIRTIFERISLCDTISFKKIKSKAIKIKCAHPAVPIDKTNLCWRAAKLLQDYSGTDKGVEIKITKRIPVAAGLGGGSSDAATTLIGLNKLWGLGLSREKLVRLAARIGADVSFFLYNTPFALGEGIGDRIKPLPQHRVRRFWHLLVVPDISVSTPLVYKEWDRAKKNKKVWLTKPAPDVKMFLSKPFFNSLEAVTLNLYPVVARVKDKLKRSGLDSVLMSGSGPAVFGILSSRKEAVSLSRKIAKNLRCRGIFVVKTT